MPASISEIDFFVPKKKNNLKKKDLFKKIYTKTGIKETYRAHKNEDVIDLALKLCKKK